VKKMTLKAVLLNPASQFKELVTKCRSIIVAGGTMQPVSEFQVRIFNYSPACLGC
jgi:chromosome transmission fidelity protein 1